VYARNEVLIASHELRAGLGLAMNILIERLFLCARHDEELCDEDGPLRGLGAIQTSNDRRLTAKPDEMDGFER
jgi:hypothetical protein